MKSGTKFRDERPELLAAAEELFEAASDVVRVIDRQGGITKHAKAVKRLREVLGMTADRENDGAR